MIDELVIKVPSPFSGIDDVGFSARYPTQELHGHLRDVPLIIEGPAEPMRRLYDRISLFVEKDRLIEDSDDDDEQYLWTPPVQLSDEICVLAFRDRSLNRPDLSDASAERSYVWNLVRPLAFTFLRDCVRIGSLRLNERIALVLDAGHERIIDLELDRSAISPDNGTMLLFGA